MDDFWICLDKPDKGRSKLRVPPGELDSQRWEDRPEVTPVVEIPRAEEGGTQTPVRERPLRDRLCDCALARSGEPVQPIDRRLVEVTGPEFDLVQNFCPCSSETTIPIAMSILGLLRISDVIKNSGFDCKRVFISDSYQWRPAQRRRCSDLGPVERGHFVFPDIDRDTHHRLKSPIANNRLLRNLLPSLMSKRAPQMRSRANLVVENSLLEIFEKPKQILIVSNTIIKPRRPWLLG